MHDRAAIHLHHVEQSLLFDGMKLAVLTETGIVDQQSIPIPFCLVRQKSFSSALARQSSGNTSVLILYLRQPARQFLEAISRRASARALFRRMPFFARATPIPAAGPGNQRPFAPGFSSCSPQPLLALFRRMAIRIPVTTRPITDQSCPDCRAPAQ